MVRTFLLIALVSLTLAACSTQDGADPDGTRASERVLTDYFAHLHAGRYEEAAALFAGRYDVMREWNQARDASPAEVLQMACENQLKCLKVRRVVGSERLSETEVRVTFELQTEDGQLFGGNEESFLTQFPCSVIDRPEGGLGVDCLPPMSAP